MFRRFFLLLASIIVTFLFIETGSTALYKITGNKIFSRKDIQKRLLTKEDNFILGITTEGPEYMNRDILHPYLGFIRDDTNRSDVNSFGFLGDEPLKKRDKDKIIIGIFGGSVAEILFSSSKDMLIDKLKGYPSFSDKKIEVVSLALSGYKQPQQLIALNYILALGGEFDIVINLDGFNELALPFSENLPNNIYPFYPRMWDLYSRKALDLPVTIQIAKINKVKKDKLILKNIFSKPFLNQSIFFLHLWRFLDKQKINELFKTNKKLQLLLSKEKTSRQTTGPDVKYLDQQGFFQNVALMWKNASLQMHNLCRTNNISYFHFLQPNQYFEGSKQLTEEEKRIAIAKEKNFSYKIAMTKAYNLLVQEGKDLGRQGVNFYDLSMIFKNDNRTIYKDKCCHYNKLGYDILTSEIAKRIHEYYQR